MVGAIGFEPTPTQPFQTLAGLGWQRKYRNGSQRNNCWTRIGHCQFVGLLVNLSRNIRKTHRLRAGAGKAPQNSQPRRNKAEQKKGD